jgi:hypothetical protein
MVSNMAQISSDDDYANLKDILINQMFVPAAGLKTTTELITGNTLRGIEDFFKMPNVPDVYKQLVRMIYTGSGETFAKQAIFGTNFESYFDAQPPFQLDQAILTGSFSEGLFVYRVEPPDLDFMCVLKNISFTEHDQEDGNLLLRDDTPFVYAFITNPETQRLWGEYFDDAYVHVEKRRLSSVKLKEKFGRNYKKAGELFPFLSKEVVDEIGEGAAVTIRKPKSSYAKVFGMLVKKALQHWNACKEPVPFSKIMHDFFLNSSDIVLSISCEGWPNCAREWVTRERLWPDVRTVEKIAQGGFHIVPKSSPDGDFRLSFSCIETMLIASLSSLQHKVLLAFKLVFKHHQNIWNPSGEKLVSTYYLKTIAFWYFEKTPPELWTDESVVHHIVALLEELQNALRRQHLPMYFMPKVDLLKDVLEPEIAMDFVEKISQLAHNFSAMSAAIILSPRKVGWKSSIDFAREILMHTVTS